MPGRCLGLLALVLSFFCTNWLAVSRARSEGCLRSVPMYLLMQFQRPSGTNESLLPRSVSFVLLFLGCRGDVHSHWASTFSRISDYLKIPHLVSSVCPEVCPEVCLDVCAQVGQNWWLSIWSNTTTRLEQEGQHLNSSKYMAVYFSLGLVSLGVQGGRALLLVLGSFNASRRLHANLLAKVMRLPMAFFDSQPTGRLLNRSTVLLNVVVLIIVSSCLILDVFYDCLSVLCMLIYITVVLCCLPQAMMLPPAVSV